MDSESSRLCLCGCGQPPSLDAKGRPRKYVAGHYHPPRACPFCGRPPATPGAKYCGPECRRQAFAAGRGRRKQGRGYIRLYRPGHPLAHKDGYVLEHRLVLYEAGVAVPPGYDVHHLNGIKDDNRPENLAVMPPSVHHSQHVGAFVVNQHGRFPVLRDAAERKARADARGREAAKLHRQRHPERVKARRCANYAAHREQIIAKVKEWRVAQRAKEGRP